MLAHRDPTSRGEPDAFTIQAQSLCNATVDWRQPDSAACADHPVPRHVGAVRQGAQRIAYKSGATRNAREGCDLSVAGNASRRDAADDIDDTALNRRPDGLWGPYRRPLLQLIGRSAQELSPPGALGPVFPASAYAFSACTSSGTGAGSVSGSTGGGGGSKPSGGVTSISWYR